MTLEEKILQLNQYTLGRNTVENNLGEAVREIPAEIGSLIYFSDDAQLRNVMQRKAMEESRLGIPILFGHDVIHGYRTIFPIPLAQACSWNPELAERACSISAQEAASSGVDWTFSPMVDVARDPRWGRVMEGYGEDVYTNSVFCEAAVRGYQGEDLSAVNSIAACLKHYVGYGASEAGRDYVPTEISDQTLWDTYLPPFEAGVKAGAATLMSAFHNISGVPASANRYILTEILKEKWGHDGFVVSDWDAVRQLRNQGMAKDGKEAALLAFNAGIEMDMVDDLYLKHIPELLDEKKISISQVDEAVRRVLRVKFRLGLFDRPYTEEVAESERYLLPESLEVAEQLAVESVVLLKNEDDVLPVERAKRIALIGPMAAARYDHLGNWIARGKADDVISISDGMKEEFADKAEIVTMNGCYFEGEDRSGFACAVKAAESSDLVVMCLGLKGKWSGENCSRSTIELPAIQEELLKAIAAVGKPMIVLNSSGRPVDLHRIEGYADAIMQIWHPGVCAGKAVAGLLSGRYNPSGKLAMTFPYNTGQIPIYYNRRNSGRRGTQGLYKDVPSEPLYEFGHGLSYSKFEYGPLTLSSDRITEDDTIIAELSVRNVSDRDGLETVHWYICDPYSHITRPVKELKFFEKKMIKAGEEVLFRFEIDPIRDLGFVDRTGRRYLDKGEYYIMAGQQKETIEVI
ncbi:MAG: glycoside hydrolase family 3 C-terminal domain-containing protein [Bacteroidales bacterium]|nr:glycoside hydrolase family 3 C-terminal domain-containing protein [Bacteroidales bacterium]